MDGQQSHHLSKRNLMMKRDRHFFGELFLIMLKLSSLTFGGGYVIIGFMRKELSENRSWLSEADMLTFAAIAQSAPGPVAVNTALLAGYKLAGLAGALVSVCGVTLPPLVIITLLSFGYSACCGNFWMECIFKGTQAAVGAIIADVAINLAKVSHREDGWKALTIAALSLACTLLIPGSTIFVLIFFALVGSVFFRSTKVSSPQGDC